MKLSITVALLACFAISAGAKTHRIKMDEHRDAPLQTTWVSPHDPPNASQRIGSLLAGDIYEWWVYPYLGVSFDRSRKWFQLAVELQGTSDAVMLPGTSLTFTMDSKQYTLPDIYPYNVGGGGCSVSVFNQFSCVNKWVIAPKTDLERESLASLVRLLSGAHEVYVTMMGGPGTNRFSIQLTEPQLVVIRRVLDEYSRY